MSSEGCSTVVTVDRIEGEYAVLVDGARQVDVPLAWLPDGVEEGTVLRLDTSRAPDDEAALRGRIEALRRRLDGSAEPDGDVDP